MQQGYDIRELDLSVEGIAQIASLLRVVFPKAAHLTENYLNWQYNRNPVGKAVGFNAWLGRDLAAHYVTIPVRYRLGSNSVLGVLSLNTATHPAHQGKKLFTILAEKTYDEAARRGTSFVVGVANANSTPGFVKKLGFQEVTRLDARLFLGSAPPGEDIACHFERAWDTETLAWRIANPEAHYARSAAEGRFRIEAPTDTFGIKAELGDFPLTLEPAHAWTRRELSRPFTLWLGLDDIRPWRTLRGGSVPERFRRSPLNLIYRSLDSRERTVERSGVRFRAIDFDPY
jgi:GNAT superfamily N-acetyltransferase